MITLGTYLCLPFSRLKIFWLLNVPYIVVPDHSKYHRISMCFSNWLIFLCMTFSFLLKFSIFILIYSTWWAELSDPEGLRTLVFGFPGCLLLLSFSLLLLMVSWLRMWMAIFDWILNIASSETHFRQFLTALLALWCF